MGLRIVEPRALEAPEALFFPFVSSAMLRALRASAVGWIKVTSTSAPSAAPT
jgi:hypothetical protein